MATNNTNIDTEPNAVTIARAVYFHLTNRSLPALIRALESEGSQHLDATALAKTLYARDDFNFNAETVAYILYSVENLHLDANAVAKILESENGLNLMRSVLAYALYSEDGLHLDAETVIGILGSKDGLNLPAFEIVSALSTEVGINLHISAIVRLLSKVLHMNVKTILHGLRFLDLSVTQIVQTLTEGLHISQAEAETLVAKYKPPQYR